MRAKLKLMLPFFIAVLLAGYSCAQNSATNARGVKRITVQLTQMADSTWKVQVVSRDGQPNVTHNDTVRVDSGALITWIVPDSTNAYFQFPNNVVLKHAKDTDTLSDNYTIFKRAHNRLILRVRDGVESGKSYTYSIFCTNGMSFAWGDSPPQIIVN